MMQRVGWIFAFFLVALTAVSPLNASPIDLGDLSFGLDQPYAGTAASPQGISPWMSAKFENLSANSVRLTMDAGNLAAGSSQWVSAWFFNFNDNLNIFNLDFTLQSGINGNSVLPNIPDGTGRLFDFKFEFDPFIFVPGAVSVYDITYKDGTIDASSFEFKSVSNDPATVNFYSAAIVQGIGAAGNLVSQIAADTALKPGPGPGPGPNPVPEPATMLLLCIGLTGLSFFGRKNFLK
jgi:hypothetical protein